MVYSKETPGTIGIDWSGPAAEHQYRQYEGYKPIAFAETAVALVAVIHTANKQTRPTTITLCTDSSVVYYILNTGKGATLRQNIFLQPLYVTFLIIKDKRGHRLVVWWVPTDANLGDPVSRGVLAT
jgi:hypothetical protein